MAEQDKQTKIQPADDADPQAGQSQDVATDKTLSDVTPEKFAKMNDAEKLAYMDNASKFIASATQKSQEAAEVKRQNEQLAAESKYYKAQAEKMEANLQKMYEQMINPPQPQARSTPSQPPEYDPYNPEKWARDYQTWHNEQLSTTRDEFNKKVEELKKEADNANVGVRGLRIEKYVEKALPEIGPDVTQEEIRIWADQHPEADWGPDKWMDTINQAIRERQAFWDKRNEENFKKYIAKKEKDAKGAQETGGSPYAGKEHDADEFVDKTPAERDKIVADGMERFLRAVEGGGK